MLEKLLKEAAKLCLDNVEQYHKDAELLVKSKSYGHAFALAVLSEEELVKALMYHMFSAGILPRHYELYLRKRLDSHLYKQAMAFGRTISNRLVELFHSIRKSVGRQADNGFEKRGITPKQMFEKMTPELVGKIRNDLERFSTLQDDKEKAMYVDFDFDRKELSSPNSLKKEEVEEYLHQAKSRFDFLKPFLSISFTPSEKKVAEAQLREFVKLVFDQKNENRAKKGRNKPWVCLC